MSPGVAAGLAAVATASAVMAAGWKRPVMDDEAWFLHVVQRCRAGEVLYRDVFFGAGPLAVWAAVAAVRATRPQLVVMRALGVAYFVGFLLAGTGVLAAAGAPGWVAVVFWAGSVAFAGPSWRADNHYSQLSYLAAAVSLAALAANGEGGHLLLAAPAGAAAAAAFAAKQSVGAVALAAGPPVLVAAGAPAGDLASFGAGAAVVVAACLAPLARAGAVADFGRRAFADKTTYLARGGMAPSEGLRIALSAGGPPGRMAALARIVAASSFLVLPAAVLAAVLDVAVLAGGGPAEARLEAAVGLAAAGTALAGAVPRTDLPHVQGLFPLALLAVLVSGDAADAALAWWPPPPVVAWPAALVLAGWGTVALVVSLDTPHRLPTPPDADDDLPHLRGIPVGRWPPGAGPRDGQALRELTGGSVFLLRSDAAWWYLAGGLRNPTPYDFPYASVFGARGQGETIEAIRRGEVRWVCLPAPMQGPLAPDELQAFVQGSMEPVAETAAGTLYRLAGRNGA